MRSLSTSAFGQPSETMPIRGWPGRGATSKTGFGARSGRRFGGFWLIARI